MPGQTMPNLIGSSMHQPSGRSSKPCQLSPGCRTQQLGSVASRSAGASWNGDPLARSSDPHLVGVPRREEPVLLRAELLLDARDGQPAGDGLVDRLLGQRLPGRAVHHGGRDVVRRDQRVERRGARLRAVRLVEAAVVDRAAAVADVDVRGLRQRREQLVRRVGREHRRPVRRVAGRIAAHGETVAVHRIEARVAVPGFVEVDAVDALRRAAPGPRRRRSTCRHRCSW